MKRTHLAIGIVGIAITLAAEPVCKRFVLPVLHRQHSKATLAKWAAWREAHPHWTQPKTLAKYDQACAPIATVDAAAVGFVLPVDAPVWVEPIVTTDALIAEVAMEQLTQSVNNLDGDGWDVLRLAAAVPTPPAAAPVPEPASVWLVLLGIGFLLSQDGVLLGRGVDLDLAAVALHLHVEDVSLFQGAEASGAAGKLGHGVAGVEEGSAAELGAVAVSVEEGDVPAIFVAEKHENAPLHGDILGEAKAKVSTGAQVVEMAGGR